MSSALVEAVLGARGLTSSHKRQAFLNPEYDQYRHDPFLLPDMDKAVARLVRAYTKHETVVIYGDYDIDGLTASTILLDSFQQFGIEASVFIPNRFVEGYGLAKSAVETLAKNGAKIIVTVDCGSLSHAEIARAEELGVDVIVTDHHSVAETKSSKTAMINPKWLLQKYPNEYEGFILKESSKKKLYPFLDLAGCGVAFKLVQALQTRLKGLDAGQEKWLLDLVALGTVCDVVTLQDENRANVLWGLRVLAKTRRPGLKLLMAVARISPDRLDSRSLGFGLGPRLNAAGRLETAQLALDLLTTSDSAKALQLAEQLEGINQERRTEQARIVASAIPQAEAFTGPVLVVSDPSWSHGIIGIVAANLLEKYHKPTFVLQELEDGTAKGSARSYGDFSAVAAIRATEHLLIKGGGHKLAAGVTLESVNIDVWRDAVNDYYRSLKLVDQFHYLEVRSDVTLPDFRLCTEGNIRDLAALEPYGNGNPSPRFQFENLIVVGKRFMGAENQHVKFRFTDKLGQSMEMIVFSKADDFSAEIGDNVTAWCELGINEWNGRKSVEGRLLRLEAA